MEGFLGSVIQMNLTKTLLPNIHEYQYLRPLCILSDVLLIDYYLVHLGLLISEIILLFLLLIYIPSLEISHRKSFCKSVDNCT